MKSSAAVAARCSPVVPLTRAIGVALLILANSLSALAATRCNDHESEKTTTTNMRESFQSILFAKGDSCTIPWLCYYGWDRSVLALPDYRLFILEADAIGALTREDKAERLCVAYISVGEISKSRWFWPLVENKTWLLEENRNWPGTWRVDPRSREWGDLLVYTVAPAILAAGYDGFMLDNVDIGEYLENTDPDVYAGAKDAMADIIRRLRDVYPEALIIANGGLDTSADVAGCIDAVVNESAFSRWITEEDGSVSYVEVSEPDRAWLRPRLLRIRGLGIPILALEYADPEDAEARRRIAEAAERAGYHPYVAERNLMLLPEKKNPPAVCGIER